MVLVWRRSVGDREMKVQELFEAFDIFHFLTAPKRKRLSKSYPLCTIIC